MANNDLQPRRTTRKEYLLTRKQQEQYRQIRLAALALGGLLLLILGIGLIFEYVIKPGQPVAEVENAEVALNDWQDRVVLERKQAIESIDQLYEAVGGDVNQLFQFAGQQLNTVASPAILGQQVLLQMIDEELIRAEAARRNISVSDAEIQAEIEEQFDFYGGELPPTPDTSQTPEPTPSITPIVSADAEPTAEPEGEPTEEPTPFPTNTPVNQAGFDELFQERLTEFADVGGSEAEYRQRIELQLLTQKLQDAFAEEQGIITEEEQVSILYISSQDRSEAEAIVADVEDGKPFLTVWNEVRSVEPTTSTLSFASEFQFTSVESISGSLGAEVAEVLETIEIGATSDIISNDTGRFIILHLRDRADRPLTEARLDQQKRELLQEWLTEAEKAAIIYESRWERNVPDRPILDPKYFTPAEPEPVIPETIPETEVDE